MQKIYLTVSQSLSNIRAANNTLNNIEIMSMKQNEKFQKWNNSMSTRLQELRDKIAKAKHAAEGVCYLFSFKKCFSRVA